MVVVYSVANVTPRGVMPHHPIWGAHHFRSGVSVELSVRLFTGIEAPGLRGYEVIVRQTLLFPKWAIHPTVGQPYVW